MALEIEHCPSVGVAYKSIQGHWDALQIATATTTGKQIGVRRIPSGRRPPGLEKRGRWGTVDKYRTVESDR